MFFQCDCLPGCDLSYVFLSNESQYVSIIYQNIWARYERGWQYIQSKKVWRNAIDDRPSKPYELN